MSKEIVNLQPSNLWKNFYALTQIPRPSKKEQQIIAFIKDFGDKLGLETLVNEVGNVLIRKPASKGYENRKGVVLQAHLDMVPQKNSDKQHDFEKDPIDAYIDGDWVTANGTTLGADNGMGVAAAMSVLEDDTLKHPAIEALFTIDEETGMTGAFNLDANWLKGDILLNLDSEDEGELYIGCAGGINTNVELPYERVKAPDGKSYQIVIKGMKGGHSGLDIVLGRGNAIKVITRILYTLESFGVSLATIEGGSLRNAIPREASATVVIPADKVGDAKSKVNELSAIISDELAATEPNLSIEFVETSAADTIIHNMVSRQLIRALYAFPNGVVRMSDYMPVPETSTNLALVKTQENKILIYSLQRSFVDTARTSLCEAIRSVFELVEGAKVEHEGDYPGWTPNPDSDILKTMKKVYNDKFGKIPEIKSIHAGLECGLMGGIYPQIDMISFGPTIRFPHSPDEKVNIATVQKFWDFLVETLKNIPVKN